MRRCHDNAGFALSVIFSAGWAGPRSQAYGDECCTTHTNRTLETHSETKSVLRMRREFQGHFP